MIFKPSERCFVNQPSGFSSLVDTFECKVQDMAHDNNPNDSVMF